MIGQRPLRQLAVGLGRLAQASLRRPHGTGVVTGESVVQAGDRPEIPTGARPYARLDERGDVLPRAPPHPARPPHLELGEGRSRIGVLDRGLALVPLRVLPREREPLLRDDNDRDRRTRGDAVESAGVGTSH